MLDRWLRNETFQRQSTFLDVRRVSADTSAEDQELEEWLGHELMRNYFDPKKRGPLVDALRSLGIEGWLITSPGPTSPTTPKW